MKSQTSSPLPKKQSPTGKTERSRLMTFPDAMKAVISGMKITRVEWPEGEYGILDNGCNRLCIFRTADNKLYKWELSEGDMMAIDWKIVV